MVIWLEYSIVADGPIRFLSRSTSNIVNAAQKVIASGAPTKAKELRQDMTPIRGAGAKPRVLACEDGKAEGKQWRAGFCPHV